LQIITNISKKLPAFIFKVDVGSLRMSENKVPRRIFELKREEVTGRCRKLHNELRI